MKNSCPHFSIVVPVYNVGDYIACALESVLAQRYTDWELIVVNDGSTDHSAQVIQGFADTDARILVLTQDNQGLSGARNAGIQVARGQYLVFLDGDDWLKPNALQVISDNIGDADLLLFSMEYAYPNGTAVPGNLRLPFTTCTGVALLDYAILASQFSLFVAWNKAYKVSMFRDKGLHFSSGILHEDNPFFVHACSLAQRVVVVNQPLYAYRQLREGAITQSRTLRHFDDSLEGVRVMHQIISPVSRSILLLELTILIFQIGVYPSLHEEQVVLSRLRSLAMKQRLLYLMTHATVRRNTIIKGLLLLIDPLVLKCFVFKMKRFFRNGPV